MNVLENLMLGLVVPTFMCTDFKLSVKCEDEIVPLTKYKVKNIWGG